MTDEAYLSDGLSARRTLCFLLFRSCCQHRHVLHRADTLKSRNIHHRETHFQSILNFIESAVLQLLSQALVAADEARNTFQHISGSFGKFFNRFHDIISSHADIGKMMNGTTDNFNCRRFDGINDSTYLYIFKIQP